MRRFLLAIEIWLMQVVLSSEYREMPDRRKGGKRLSI